MKHTAVEGELRLEDIHIPSQKTLKIIASKRGLERLNKNLGTISKKTFLVLDENHFHRLPIKELQKINDIAGLSMNKQRTSSCGSSNACSASPIFTIPDSIHVLPNLVELSLQYNRIGELPYYIVALQNLQVLDLTSNCIRYLPDELFLLQNLQYLGLSSNNLTIVSEDVAKLKKLRVLRLSKNNLKSLPDSICQLQDLMCLSLKDNQLIFLPPRLFELNKCTDDSQVFRAELLKRQVHAQIRVQGNNNLMFPPYEICSDSSTDEIFQYMRRVQENEMLLERLLKDARAKVASSSNTTEGDHFEIAVGGKMPQSQRLGLKEVDCVFFYPFLRYSGQFIYRCILAILTRDNRRRNLEQEKYNVTNRLNLSNHELLQMTVLVCEVFTSHVKMPLRSYVLTHI